MAKIGTKFVFRKNDNIGAAAAEEDSAFLDDCYVDTGDIDCLFDCNDPRRIIVGRTGSGKTALMNELSSRAQNIIEISPHSLSLNYIANNNVIAFFEAAGVNLAIFYGLLWKHILVVELLKKKFNIRNDAAQKNYARRVRELLYKNDKNKEMAVDYLEKWGNKFWLTTEERIRELTTKIEKSLSGSVEGSIAGLTLSADGARRLSNEERIEVIHRGQEAVSEVQIRELETMISVLAENVFNDNQEHYYICIDMLDEEWADDRIRYRLIRALFDAIRRLRKLENIKVIVSMRQDLLGKVLHSTREGGFQEEKYESMYLSLRWSKALLSELIERRINHLVRHRYTKQIVGIKDILPSQIKKEPSVDYMIARTFSRPRDLILFLNDSIAEADGQPSISEANILKAEHEYSYKRLQSLATEWRIIYPNLFEVAQIFYGLKERIPVSEVTEDFILQKYEEIACDIADPNAGRLTRLLNSLYSEKVNFGSVRNSFLRDLYVTGLVGIKRGPGTPISWSHLSRLSLAPGAVRPNSTIYIHPMFHRALNIKA